MKNWTALGGVLLTFWLVAGCGGGGPAPEDAKPFAAAIEKYLKDHSMGMKVEAFESLEVTGDTAKASVKMAAKDLGYGLRPTWQITFERKSGVWQVSHVDR